LKYKGALIKVGDKVKRGQPSAGQFFIANPSSSGGGFWLGGDK